MRDSDSLQDMIAHQLSEKLNALVEKMSTSFGRNVLPNNEALQQKLFLDSFHTKHVCEPNVSSSKIMDAGFRVYSQNNEDGILLAIFSILGMGKKTFIEIGANCFGSDIGNPEACGVNLAVNHDWHGLFIEADTNSCNQLTYFFARHATTKHFHLSVNESHSYYSPKIVNSFVDEYNVTQILHSHRLEKDIDLLSIDIDGNDIIVAEAILEKFKPRVLLVEFEKRLGFTHSVYQSNRDDFNRHFSQSGTVSLAAWHKMLSKYGYSLVALNNTCFNAFFVSDNANQNRLESISPKQAYEKVHIFKSVPSEFWLEPDSTWNKY